MERRQRNFLILIAALVILFITTLVVLQTFRERTAPVPETPIPQVTATPQPTQTAPPTTPEPGKTATPPGTPSPEVTPTPEGPEARQWYVSPGGSKENDGSQDYPWELQYALNHPSRLQPGDTIWLLEGQYTGTYTSRLEGEPDRPITVRAVPGQRAILENDGLVLDISTSHYVNFWGLEIRPTQNLRNPDDTQRSAYGVRINQGKESHHIKFINMIVHDMPSQGFGWWQANKDSEIYGSLIFFNGITQFEHGIYLHNSDGEKRIIDNIIFDNASHGIHAYGEKDYQELNNITIEGNTIFNNGSIGYVTNQGKYGVYKRNILVGSSQLAAQHPVITHNYTYYPGSAGEALNLGYKAGSRDAVIEDNYFAGGEVTMGGTNSDVTMLENTIMGAGMEGILGFASTQNNVLLFKPAGAQVFVRPNQYEVGRANVTIYNWGLAPSVTLTAQDLAGLQIHQGDHYELRNVQDYFSDVVSGTFDGEKIEVPMQGHTVAQPMGLNFKPASTFPEFGAFVLFVTPMQ